MMRKFVNVSGKVGKTKTTSQTLQNIKFKNLYNLTLNCKFVLEYIKL